MSVNHKQGCTIWHARCVTECQKTQCSACGWNDDMIAKFNSERGTKWQLLKDNDGLRGYVRVEND